MSQLVGAEVGVYCDHHRRAPRVAGFTRVAEGHVRENGYMHSWPRVWLFDNGAQQGPSGPTNEHGLRRWYDSPRAGRVLSRADESGAYLRCPRCKRDPWPEGLGWDKLAPILDTLIADGNPTITLTALTARLR